MTRDDPHKRNRIRSDKKKKGKKNEKKNKDEKINANDFCYAKRKKLERRPRRERRRDDGSDDSGRSRYEVGVGDANDAGAEIRVRRLAFFVRVWWRIFRCR